MNELNVKIGDKLLYQRYGITGMYERVVTVTKVTKTGRIRIDYDSNQYDKYGEMMGSWNIWDSKPHLYPLKDDDMQRIKEKRTILKAVILCGDVKTNNISYEQALEIIKILEVKHD